MFQIPGVLPSGEKKRKSDESTLKEELKEILSNAFWVGGRGDKIEKGLGFLLNPESHNHRVFGGIL